RRHRPAGEEQAASLQPLAVQGKAVFLVTVVVLVRLGVDDDGAVHAGVGHCAEQLLWGGRVVRTVGGVGVGGERPVGPAGEAADGGVERGGTPGRRRGGGQRAGEESTNEGAASQGGRVHATLPAREGAVRISESNPAGGAGVVDGGEAGGAHRE